MKKSIVDWFPIMGVFLFALSVRVVYILTVGQDYTPRYDSGQYYTLSTHILKDQCFCFAPPMQSVERAPLWPALIALIEFLFGRGMFYPRFFLGIIGSLTCVLVYLFARELFGRRVALFTGVVAAMYTGLFIYDGWLYTESLYNFLFVAFAYSLFMYQRTDRIVYVFCTSATIALCALTRPNGLLLVGLVIIWAVVLLWTKVFSWKKALFVASAISIIACLLVAPWTVRNYVVKGKFIPVATGGGILFSGIYNDAVFEEHPMFGLGMWVRQGLVRPVVKNPQTEEGHINAAKEWILNNPEKMPYLLTLHFLNTWKPYTSEEDMPFIQFPERYSSQLVWHMIWVTSPVIFALAALGLIVTWKRWRRDLLVCYLVIALTIISNIVIYGSMRFRSPIEPFLVVLAGGACWWLYTKVMSHLPAFHTKRST